MTTTNTSHIIWIERGYIEINLMEIHFIRDLLTAVKGGKYSHPSYDAFGCLCPTLNLRHQDRFHLKLQTALAETSIDAIMDYINRQPQGIIQEHPFKHFIKDPEYLKHLSQMCCIYLPELVKDNGIDSGDATIDEHIDVLKDWL